MIYYWRVTGFSGINIVIGILSIIIGLVFVFNISALSFLFGLIFYIIGILLILAGIAGIVSGGQISKIASVLIIILGIISFAIGGLSIGQPIFAAILIGVSLIIEGIGIYLE